MADVLRQAKTAADDACRHGVSGLDPDWLADMSRAYTVGYNVTSGRRNEVEAKHHALARRLLDRRKDGADSTPTSATITVVTATLPTTGTGTTLPVAAGSGILLLIAGTTLIAVTRRSQHASPA